MHIKTQDAEKAFDSAVEFVSDAAALAQLDAPSDVDALAAFRYWAASRTGEVDGIPIAYGRVLFRSEPRKPWWNESSPESLPFAAATPETGLGEMQPDGKKLSDEVVMFSVSIAVLEVRDRLRQRKSA